MCRATTELLIRRFLEATKGAAEEELPGIGSTHRFCLNPQAALLFLDVHRGMNSAQESMLSFGREVYHPVCRTYGVPVVSVRDAIWPDEAPLRPGLWDTKGGAHPLWSGHQLITDLLAFAWTLAGNQSLWGITSHLLGSHEHKPKTTMDALTLLLNGSDTIQNLPHLFQRARGNEVNRCPGGKHLSTSPSASSGLKPSRPDTKGWQYVDHKGKHGWEYSLAKRSRHDQDTESSSVFHGTTGWEYTLVNPSQQDQSLDLDSIFHSVAPVRRCLKAKAKRNTSKSRGQSLSDNVAAPPIPRLPLALRNESDRELPGIISFPGRFNADDPGLLVEYIRSYANYGQAIVFVTACGSQSYDRHVDTGNSASAAVVRPSYKELEARARVMLRLAWADHKYASVCKRSKTKDVSFKGQRINYR